MIEISPCNPENTKVALLYGGKSTERGISLLSGKAVANGLRDAGFITIEFDTAEPHYIDKIEETNPDVVYICLHGKGGEDGCVQGVCKELGLPFTGSGVLASALAMDKSRAKIIYESQGINTPASINVEAGEIVAYEEIAAELGNKFVVKPATEGSAYGVSIVTDNDSFNEAIKNAEELDSNLVIEQYIAGIEITVPIVGNDELMALPIIEIVPKGEFYDFDSKYSAGGADHICPARISEEVQKRCEEAAIAAHKGLGCRGVSRTDMIIDENGIPWVLETNTIPGMTETSLIPDAASHMGIGFSDFCKMMVELALEDAQ